MASHTYRSQTPSSSPLKQTHAEFFENFYKISDDPTRTDEYVQSFTKNAVFVLASKKAEGESEIRVLREGMWTKVQSRLHSPRKIFPFGTDANEVMIYGTVSFVLKNGGKAEVDWAARAVLEEDGRAWKMSFYQVYLDTATMTPTK